ncbi:tyrosine-protein phosphatase non-receptor type substrate 1-like [Acipenser oxyrinchus oxyrinchus]|uniref:Tyrosine-protein phosphatase non-receptor type substrate 1-like n=1 Tax=Acipenser oxyrinchus oxyrinchus TaxID=40147 RepID=A0AAD8CGY9_ACIOX|nr:tyrosine-protein phosphatase non-receptor type substrate 1-like [Acipenser oxyrinchus oxyrinchus]
MLGDSVVNLSAVLLGESVLLFLTQQSIAVRLDRMERGLLVSLVILVCSPSRGVSQTIITQAPGSVTGTEEGEVTVPCTVTGGPPGPVRWYRDTGSGRQYLYSPSPPPPNERNDPCVSQVHQNHATDLSIRIVRLTVNDSGMYYCDKYGGFFETPIASGSGSRLSVRVLPPPIITQPPDRRVRSLYPAPCPEWVLQDQVHPDHPTDFSIRIVRLTLRDSGIYYCEKYRGIDETLIASGSGTRLRVRGEGQEAPCSSSLFLRRLKRVDAE